MKEGGIYAKFGYSSPLTYRISSKKEFTKVLHHTVYAFLYNIILFAYTIRGFVKLLRKDCAVSLRKFFSLLISLIIVVA
ncbi:unnamed protein product, partial [marine sediment metagenome]